MNNHKNTSNLKAIKNILNKPHVNKIQEQDAYAKNGSGLWLKIENTASRVVQLLKISNSST